MEECVTWRSSSFLWVTSPGTSQKRASVGSIWVPFQSVLLNANLYLAQGDTGFCLFHWSQLCLFQSPFIVCFLLCCPKRKDNIIPPKVLLRSSTGAVQRNRVSRQARETGYPHLNRDLGLTVVKHGQDPFCTLPFLDLYLETWW